MGYGDESSWGAVVHPNDPRIDSGHTCPLCHGECDLEDHCLTGCPEVVDASAVVSCIASNQRSDKAVSQRWVEADLERLRLETAQEKHPFLRPALESARAKVESLIPSVDTAYDRNHCSQNRSPSDEVFSFDDADVLELALAAGQALEDRDTLVEHLKLLRHYGQHKQADALERTLKAAGFGPDEEEEPQHAVG